MTTISKKMLAASIAAMLLAGSTLSVSFADYDDNDEGTVYSMEKKHSKGHGKLDDLLTDSEKEALDELKDKHVSDKDELAEGDWSELSDDELKELKSKMKEQADEYHAEMKEILKNNSEALELLEKRESKKGGPKLHKMNGEEMNEYRDGMKGKNGFKMKIEALLTDSEKEAFTELKEAHQEEREEMSKSDWNELSDEEKDELKEKMMEKMEAHHDAMREVLANNEEALALFEEHVDKMIEKKEMKGERKEMRGELKDARGERNDEMSENRGTFKEKKKYYKGEKKDLTNEVKELATDDELAEIEELRAEHRTQIEALKSKKDNWKELSDEEKEIIKNEFKTLQETHYAELKVVLANNTAALEELEKIKELHNEAKDDYREMRENNKEARSEFREKRGNIVNTYKTAFVSKLGNKLDNIPAERLETVLERIDVLEEKFESNDTLTDALASQLQALREIIEDRINTELDDEIDLEELLNV